MCHSKTQIASIAGFYFLGYICGAMFFFMPNYYGRRFSMNFALVGLVIGNTIISHGTSVLQLKIGFLLDGIFHLKIPLSFIYVTELF